MTLPGCAIIIAFRFMQTYPIVRILFPREVTFPLVQILGIASLLTVLNLAFRGLGLPFATVLSRKLAADWLYRRSRNPMLLSCLFVLIAAALWLQSLHALL